MTLPTRRAAAIVAAGFPLALLPVLVGAALWKLWAAALAATLAAGVVDLFRTLPPDRVRVALDAPDTLYIGEAGVLALRLEMHRWRRAVRFEVVCDLDPLLAVQPGTSTLVRPATPSAVDVPLVPLRRGTADVSAVWLRWTAPFGLVQRIERRRVDRTVAIVPNVRGVHAAALRFFANRRFLAGLKRERYVGEGSEFESLREYLPGFDHRAIDWKASARGQRLLVRQYRAERNHHVVLAFDTGYLMSEPLDAVPRLDHAINAGLLIAYVALKTGDRLSLFAFDETVRLYTEPRSGVHAFAGVQRHTARLAYSHCETNFTYGLVELDQRLHRRSLVIVLTDFVDTVTAELMVESLGRLGRRHLIVFVALKDVLVEARSDAAPKTVRDVHRSLAARDLVRERDLVLGRLRRQGVHCVDAPPAAVSTALVNRYLDIKRRELV